MTAAKRLSPCCAPFYRLSPLPLSLDPYSSYLLYFPLSLHIPVIYESRKKNCHVLIRARATIIFMTSLFIFRAINWRANTIDILFFFVSVFKRDAIFSRSLSVYYKDHFSASDRFFQIGATVFVRRSKILNSFQVTLRQTARTSDHIKNLATNGKTFLLIHTRRLSHCK